MALSTASNFTKPDDAFRAIVEAHRGLSDEQSADLDAALVLVLAAAVSAGVLYWPGGQEDAPVVAVFLLFALAFGATVEARAAGERLQALRPGAVAALVLLGVAALGAIPGIGLAIVVAIIEFLWDGWRP